MLFIVVSAGCSAGAGCGTCANPMGETSTRKSVKEIIKRFADGDRKGGHIRSSMEQNVKERIGIAVESKPKDKYSGTIPNVIIKYHKP